MRVLNAVGLPVLWGILCGLLAGVDAVAYIVLLGLGMLGAFGAGRQHTGTGAGALRGVAAGLMFGSCILAGHALSGATANVLPDPQTLQIAFAGAVATVLGATGGFSRAHRSEAST